LSLQNEDIHFLMIIFQVKLPHTGSKAVMHRIHFLIPALYKLFTYSLLFLFTSLRMGQFCFEAGSCNRWPNLALVFCVYFLL